MTFKRNIKFDVPRSEFKSIVDAALKNTPTMPKTAKQRVRKSADTINRVKFGSWYDTIESCGCPLSEANLSDYYGEPTELAQELGVRRQHLAQFINTFDPRIRELVGQTVGYYCNSGTIHIKN